MGSFHRIDEEKRPHRGVLQGLRRARFSMTPDCPWGLFRPNKNPNQVVLSLGGAMEEKELQGLVKQMKEDLDAFFPSFYEATKKSIYLNIYSFTRSHEASEDILQETYIRFIENLSGVKENGSPLGLLYTISRNLSLNYIKKREKEISLEGSFPDPDNYFGAEEKKDDGSYFVFIRSFLSEREYRIVTLHAVEEMPHREIAAALKIPIGTVTWSYNNAIKKIRKEERKHESQQARHPTS